jgi:hypothetical protein
MTHILPCLSVVDDSSLSIDAALHSYKPLPDDRRLRLLCKIGKKERKREGHSQNHNLSLYRANLNFLSLILTILDLFLLLPFIFTFNFLFPSYSYFFKDSLFKASLRSPHPSLSPHTIHCSICVDMLQKS